MGTNPSGSLTFVLVWGFYMSIVLGAQASVPSVPECEDPIDFLTGCSSTISAILSIGVLGTIPGAPDMVNAFFALIGLVARANIIWAILQLFRGS